MLASPGVAAYFGGRREAKEMLSKGMGHTFRVGEEDYSVASEVTTRFQESAYEKMQNWFLQAAGLAGDGGPLETFLLLANERIMSLVDLARSNSKSTEDDASLQQAKGDEGDEGETSDGSDTEDDGLGPYLGQFAHPLPFQLAHPPPDYSYTRPAAKRRKAPGLADIYQKVHAQKKPGEAEIVYQKAHKRPKAKAGLAEIYQQAHATKAGKSGANAGDKQSRDDLQHLVILAAQAANAAAEVPGPPPQKASAPPPPPRRGPGCVRWQQGCPRPPTEEPRARAPAFPNCWRGSGCGSEKRRAGRAQAEGLLGGQGPELHKLYPPERRGAGQARGGTTPGPG